MIEITAATNGALRVDATNGISTAVMDEPVDAGGTDAGLTPKQMLLASLAGCTAMTLKMYAARKDWPLEHVNVHVTLAVADRSKPDDANQIVQTVELVGDLDDDQRERLRTIAGRCPVHRIMEGPTVFEEHLAEPTPTE